MATNKNTCWLKTTEDLTENPSLVPDMLHAGAWCKQATLSAVWSQFKTLEGFGSSSKTVLPSFYCRKVIQRLPELSVAEVKKPSWLTCDPVYIKVLTSSISVEATCVLRSIWNMSCRRRLLTCAVQSGDDLHKIPEYRGEPVCGSIQSTKVHILNIFKKDVSPSNISESTG